MAQETMTIPGVLLHLNMVYIVWKGGMITKTKEFSEKQPYFDKRPDRDRKAGPSFSRNIMEFSRKGNENIYKTVVVTLIILLIKRHFKIAFHRICIYICTYVYISNPTSSNSHTPPYVTIYSTNYELAET